MEKLDFLIKILNSEIEIPEMEQEKKDLFRTLMNTWKVSELPSEFYEVQDEYLQGVLKVKGITKLEELTEIEENIYLWQGDITTLEVDAIVNAANKALLGCLIPLHRCIDNAIHSQAGLQLRKECDDIIKAQELLASATATQEEVDKALETLKEAEKKVSKKSIKDILGGFVGKETKKESTFNVDEDFGKVSKSNSLLAKTGLDNNATAYAGIAVLVLVGLTVYVKRRKQK